MCNYSVHYVIYQSIISIGIPFVLIQDITIKNKYMEKSKLCFGKILGELYRIESNMGMACPASEATIYGLLNGIESVIDEEINSVGSIPNEKFTAVADVLTPYWNDRQKLAEFKGYYDIEPQLKSKGVNRGEAITVLKYFKANGQFIELIDKMDSSDSPCECRTFELSDWDK